MHRILVYSHDTYGLGNIRRMVAIVEHLAGAIPDVCVLLVSGSPMLQSFRLPPQVDYVKLPCLHRSERGHYGSRYLDLPSETLARMRAGMILETARAFAPDLVLVDKKPLGVLDELEPTLRLLRAERPRVRLALVLREILDSPERTRAVWARNDYYGTVESLYHSVLVLGSRAVFDTAREYALGTAIRRRLRYCGYIRKRAAVRPRDVVRAELRAGDAPLVVLTAGGGRDGYRVLRSGLDALAPDIAARRVYALVVSGPEMAPDAVAELRRVTAAHTHASLVEFSDDLLSYLHAADAVVSMAGYNTVTEILGFERRAVLMPRTAPSLEQHLRASRLHALGLCTMVELERTSASELRATILDTLDGMAPAPASRGVEMNGLERVGEAVETLLRDSRAERGDRARRRVRRAPRPSAIDDAPRAMALVAPVT